MKNTNRFKAMPRIAGVIAVAIIMVSMVFVSCGGSSVSGTFYDVDDPDDYFTFTGSNYTGIYGGGEVSGTFSVADKTLTAVREGFNPFVFTVVDKDTLLLVRNSTTWKKR